MSSRIIYQSAGRAREYGEWAATLYKGCESACAYCYCPATIHMTREEFHVAVMPKPDAINRFHADLHAMQKRGITEGKIFMSFGCDPYPEVERDLQITRQAIWLAHKHGFGVDILTKNGSLVTRDMPLLGKDDSFGVTLTLLEGWEQWEPYADSPDWRIQALNRAWHQGIPTWVSLEPVIEPEQTMEIIRKTHKFVDHYKVGKLNYHTHAKTIDWPGFAVEVRDLLEELHCKYTLKEDLRRLVHFPDAGKMVVINEEKEVTK